jgi:hypothetical protein
MSTSSSKASASLSTAEECHELVFPPTFIYGRDSPALSEPPPNQRFNVLHWMNSSKDEHRVHAALESDLKSLVSVQYEIIRTFWLNFAPAIEDVAAIKRCFRLSKVVCFACLHVR